MKNPYPFMLFAGSSHPELAKQVANGLGCDLGRVSLSTFPDCEIGVEIHDNVRGRDVFVLQTIARRPNHYLMELLIMIDALKRASVHSVTAVIPYFGYCRQDRKDKGRVPITARLVADMIESAGADRVLTMDLHAEQIQGFFSIPVDHLLARPALRKAVEQSGLDDYVVVAPDIGSIKLARAFTHSEHGELAIVDKHRVDAERVETGALIGNVKDRNVVLIDDMISTGQTLKRAADVCKRAGAKRVLAVATHGLMVDKVPNGSAIEKTFVTNTIPCPESDNLEVVSVAPLFSQAIESIHTAQSISSLHQ